MSQDKISPTKLVVQQMWSLSPKLISFVATLAMLDVLSARPVKRLTCQRTTSLIYRANEAAFFRLVIWLKTDAWTELSPLAAQLVTGSTSQRRSSHKRWRLAGILRCVRTKLTPSSILSFRLATESGTAWPPSRQSTSLVPQRKNKARTRLSEARRKHHQKQEERQVNHHREKEQETSWKTN